MAKKQVIKSKEIPKYLLKIFHDFKAELVGDFGRIKSESTKYNKELKKAEKDEELAEKKIANHPIYKSINRKSMSSDYPKFTDEEREYMETDSGFKECKKALKKQINIETKIRNDLVRRLKNGTATDKEKRKFENQEMWIHNDRRSDGQPTIHIDSTYSEVLSGELGYNLADKYIEKLRKKLKPYGYDIEPYSDTRLDLYKDN